MSFALPVVRARGLPDVDPRARRGEGVALEWRDGPDVGAAVVVGAVALASAALGIAVLSAAPHASAVEAAAVAAAAIGLGATGLAAAAGELLRDERIRIAGRRVEVSRRGLGGRRRWSASVEDFDGVEALDRQRRFFVRNRGRSALRRFGPVTEFVLVLRHGAQRGRDLELFRAQPSLETLRAMHAMRTTRAGAAAGIECEQLARGYRDALATLCRACGLPALVANAAVPVAPQEVHRLDPWLERPAAP